MLSQDLQVYYGNVLQRMLEKFAEQKQSNDFELNEFASSPDFLALKQEIATNVSQNLDYSLENYLETVKPSRGSSANSGSSSCTQKTLAQGKNNTIKDGKHAAKQQDNSVLNSDKWTPNSKINQNPESSDIDSSLSSSVNQSSFVFLNQNQLLNLAATLTSVKVPLTQRQHAMNQLVHLPIMDIPSCEAWTFRSSSSLNKSSRNFKECGGLSQGIYNALLDSDNVLWVCSSHLLKNSLIMQPASQLL
ncbi:hypothetical protein Ciccas_004458 [Cichlidogyrus casuarinus]|uniref:Uncharacterized protein n=1 Tax=Cichlidogyrus casuarinus TaxID=1844966 RepID=A0ABD2QBK6_9PLAT